MSAATNRCRHRGAGYSGTSVRFKTATQYGFFRESEGVYFVRFGGNKVKRTLELVTMSDMLETTGNEYKIWRIFNMAEERDKWMD